MLWFKTNAIPEQTEQVKPQQTIVEQTLHSHLKQKKETQQEGIAKEHPHVQLITWKFSSLQEWKMFSSSAGPYGPKMVSLDFYSEWKYAICMLEFSMKWAKCSVVSQFHI